MSDFEPPKDVNPWMVCAACKHPETDRLVLGPRHWDPVMVRAAQMMGYGNFHVFDQGFIDQWGRFYTREEARECVRISGQPFSDERNGGHKTQLFSEGLY